jgi:hypothetical protein
MKLLISAIRSTEKGLGYKHHEAIHAQIKAFEDDYSWCSAEEKGVIFHYPILRDGRRYKLIQYAGPITENGLKAMQAYCEDMRGTKYDKGQLISILIKSVKLFPMWLRKWAARRVDGGAANQVCSTLVGNAIAKAIAASNGIHPQLPPPCGESVTQGNWWESITPEYFNPDNWIGTPFEGVFVVVDSQGTW